MRSSNRLGKRGRLFQIILIAALVVVSRAPFLVRGDRFFDSDEAVEGLMASHVLAGEHPAFMWGQRYKGVPEVYLTAAVFAVTGPSVVALKSVTLACFALFVALQFVLATRLFSTAVGWLATVFLVLAPPSVVFWSLSANAEIVLTLLAGTVIYIGFDRWRRTGAPAALALACAALGFGLWVQQFIAYYIVALALAVVYDLPQRRRVFGWLVARCALPPWARVIVCGLGGVGLVYLALGAAAFLTGGFDLNLAGFHIGIHHPQKFWRIAVGLLVMTAAIRVVPWFRGPNKKTARTHALVASLAFAVGYSPALVGRILGGGSTPVARADLGEVTRALSPMVREIVPIVFGFRSPTTAWLGVPLWLGSAIVIAMVASTVSFRRQAFTPVFHGLLVAAPVMFILSGAFVDAQSYRYLMPMAGAVSVVMGLGVLALFRRSHVAGAALFVALATAFAWEQRAWYQSLQPDTQAAALVECLGRQGIRGAYADYWLSYKLTFLTHERSIVAPNSGMDRYPPYQTVVRAQPSPPIIPATIGPLCGSPPSLSR